MALAIGCGSATANKGDAAGTGGAAGTSGASGTAGTSGTAGMIGAAGSSGTGGGATGGVAGVGGASGASGTGGAGGDCSATLPLTGGYVGETPLGNNMVPLPMGGAIADGTYDLTEIDDYVPSTPGPTAIKETLRVTGNLLERSFMSNTDPGPSYYRYTTTTSGTQWTWMYVCQRAASGPRPYTATANTISIRTASYQYSVYTKR